MKENKIKNKEEKLTTKLKNKQGITLVALIVTIIVLLILAGVSIAMLTGENGILSQAQNAKERTNEAAKNEQLDLAKQEDLINETLNGVEVEQVTDTAPGVLEVSETESNTYTINSIEDLVFFAYDVTNGNNYSGKTVKLGTSLDFNSTKSYVDPYRTNYSDYGYDGALKTLLTSGKGFLPIGTIYDKTISMNHFYGTFDGNYNTIYNLYQNIEESENTILVGLFGTNMGTIKNLQIKNANLNGATDNMHVIMGAIAGRNGGDIENCSSEGNLNINANGVRGIYAGGISGQGDGQLEGEKINKCYSKMNIKVEATNSNSVFTGGIGSQGADLISNCYFGGKIEITGLHDTQRVATGIGISISKIENCYNSGTLIVKTEDTIEGKGGYLGGIANSSININNCYNVGTIESYNPANHVGGIDGNLQNGSITNCYNSGKITVEGTNNSYGSLIGTANNSTINNSKWLLNTAPSAIGSLQGTTTDNSERIDTLEEMPSVLEIINGEGTFKEDTNNINNGYPILEWE